MNSYTVDKNVPVPPPAVPSKWKDLYDSMAEGDSVHFKTDREAHGFCSAVWRMHRKGKVSKRPEGNGYRVWKLRSAG